MRGLLQGSNASPARNTIAPAKADRSEGFLSIFIDFHWFLFKNIILYMKIEPGWWRLGPEYILKYFCIWKRPKRLNFESQNLYFHFFRLHFRKCHVLLFLQIQLFESQISKSPSYKMFLRTIRTILGFTIFLTLTWIFSSKSSFLRKSHFLKFL